MLRYLVASVLLLSATTAVCSGASTGFDTLTPNIADTLTTLVQDCKPNSVGDTENMWSCLRVKALSNLDRVVRDVVYEWQERDLHIMDNIVLTKSKGVKKARSTNIDDDSLPEVVTNFLASRTLEIHFPNDLVPSVARNIEEARGKLKKMGGTLLAGLVMMKGTLAAMALGALALISGKALTLSMLALLLSIVAALKKASSGGDHHRRSGRRADTTASTITQDLNQHQTWGIESVTSAATNGDSSAHNLAYRGQTYNYN